MQWTLSFDHICSSRLHVSVRVSFFSIQTYFLMTYRSAMIPAIAEPNTMPAKCIVPITESIHWFSLHVISHWKWNWQIQSKRERERAFINSPNYVRLQRWCAPNRTPKNHIALVDCDQTNQPNTSHHSISWICEHIAHTIQAWIHRKNRFHREPHSTPISDHISELRGHRIQEQDTYWISKREWG